MKPKVLIALKIRLCHGYYKGDHQMLEFNMTKLDNVLNFFLQVLGFWILQWTAEHSKPSRNIQDTQLWYSFGPTGNF